MKLLVFSDIHNDHAALRRLMDIEADYYFAAGDLGNWSRGLDQAGEILKRRAGKVYALPGNHETERDIAAMCDKFGFVNFHGASLEAGGWHIAGLGYSNPTPFDTPGEYSEAELAHRLEPFAALDPLILICHCPPKGSQLDLSGNGQHFGSTAIAQFIARRQPAYFFCGHIHEAAGVTEQIGATQATNVGKKGYLLEVDRQ
jgi:Icc-related predicted phosphoesterase